MAERREFAGCSNLVGLRSLMMCASLCGCRTAGIRAEVDLSHCVELKAYLGTSRLRRAHSAPQRPAYC